jgi:hypothetical protein
LPDYPRPDLEWIIPPQPNLKVLEMPSVPGHRVIAQALDPVIGFKVDDEFVHPTTTLPGIADITMGNWYYLGANF